MNIETLTRQYLNARDTYLTSRIGPKTDKAAAQMERIVERAEKHGLLEQLIEATTN